jgi:hypothetical protein
MFASPQLIVDQSALDPTIEAPEKHPQLQALHRYWLERCDGSQLPARRAIEPIDLKRHLPNLLLVDVGDAPRRFRYRLFGTALVALYKREMTGRYVDEIQSDTLRAAAVKAYSDVIARRAPVFSTLVFVIDDYRIKYDRVLLPLAADGRTITMVMGAVIRR